MRVASTQTNIGVSEVWGSWFSLQCCDSVWKISVHFHRMKCLTLTKREIKWGPRFRQVNKAVAVTLTQQTVRRDGRLVRHPGGAGRRGTTGQGSGTGSVTG